MIPGIPAEFEFKKTPIFLEFLRHGNFRVTKKKRKRNRKGQVCEGGQCVA